MEQALFHYLGTTLDSGLTFMAHLNLIRSRIWSSHYQLANARSCPRTPLSSGPATILYHVHALSHLVVLHAPLHREQLQLLRVGLTLTVGFGSLARGPPRPCT